MVILVLATPVWLIAQGALASQLPVGTLSRWRNLWFFVTLALFLSHSYWLFAFLLIATMMAVRRQEAHVVGLFFVLLFAGSPVPINVPGFGLVNYVLILDHYRLLTLSLLAPAALVLMQGRRTIALGRAPIDAFALGYFLLISVLEFRESSITDGARGVVTQAIDVLLPYYVVSRSIRDIDGFKAAMTGFVIAACVMAPLAVFESLRSWRLYTAVQAPLGLNPLVWSGYSGRAGLLRATLSLGHPIVLGFVFMVALGFLTFLHRSLPKAWCRQLAWASLIVGLLVSISRGPWVGALILGLVTTLIAANPLKNLVKGGLMMLLIVALLGAFPAGQQFLDLMPFLGEEEAGSVNYRVELWSFVWPVVERNFWLGSENFLQAPELRVLAAIQGEGIADLVNHYFEVVLANGVTGLVLFGGAFVSALQVVWRGMSQKMANQEQKSLGVALFCTVLAVSATISTVSNVTAISVIVWSLLGMSAAYSVMVRDSVRQNRTA